VTVHVLPDAEKLVIDWALDVPELDDQFDGRIYGAVPASPTFPLARVIRIGGVPTSRLLWLDNAVLQVDVWGGPKSTTRLAAETFRAHAADSLGGSHALGCVTAVEVGGLTWLPDNSYAPAKPRYSFDLSVTYHP
jgi:hypothetical protein